MPLDIEIDLSALIDLTDELDDRLRKSMDSVCKEVAEDTKKYIIELATGSLHSSKEKYIEGLSVQGSDSFYTVSLDDSATFLEEGMSSFDMLPGLLGSKKAKMGKHGLYVIIAFKHSANAPSQQNDLASKEKILSNAIRETLKKNKIPLQKMERTPKGKIKTGLLHKLDIPNPNGVGKSTDTSPYLERLHIYQQKAKDKQGRLIKRKGKQQYIRSFVSFRTASESQMGSGKWQHPGIKGAHLFETAYAYGIDLLERRVKEELDKLQ